MQQHGGSHYGVHPLDVVPQFSPAAAAAAAGQRQQRMIGSHVGGDQPAGEPAAPISSRSAPPQLQDVVSRSPAMIFDELAGGGGGGAAMRSFADEEALGAGEEGEKGGGVGSRWPRQETLALLKIRSEMDAAFRDATLKGPIWEDVSRKLAELGYKRSAKKCKEKFENVHKYYKRTKESRAGRQDGKSYRFFTQLEALHATAVSPLSPPLPAAPSIAAPPPDRAEPPPAVAAGASFSSNSSSSSSSDTDGGGRKRKRDGRPSATGRTMAFFEKLMRQLIAQQEAMQQRFLETIERREQDRMIREEAWKRQEMARLNREYELMAEERTLTANRDAAVISFLQKFTNHPNPSVEATTVADVSSAPEARGEPPQQEDQSTEDRRLSRQGNEIVIHQLSVSAEPAASAAETAPEAALSSRWPKAEVLALIKLRSALEIKYLEAGPKGPLWEEISLGMKRLGYSRSTKRCKEKWENINKYFKKVKEGNKKRSEDAKTCPYFHELDAIYRRKHQQESAASNPAPMISLAAEQEKNMVTVRGNVGNGGNLEGSGFQMHMQRSNIANGISQGFFGGASDANALKKPEDIVKELMERQNHEEEEDDDDDEYDDDEDDDDGKMRYEIQFQRQSVGAAGDSHGGNAAGKPPASAPPSSNAGSFLAMVQ